jgi:hypothetical protein
MDLGDRVDEFTFLVRDRAGQFMASFEAVLADVGSRWSGFLRVLRGKLPRRIAQYIWHYNGRRPHRSRELRPPRPTHPMANLNSPRIKRQQLLGGLINEYEQAA